MKYQYIYLIKDLTEIIYLIYIFNFFKTKIYFSNIFNELIQHFSSEKKIDFLHHSYQPSKHVCVLGKILGWIAVLWFVARNFVPITNKKLRKINLGILIAAIILSFIMNLNVFIYLIPIFIIEGIWNIVNLRFFRQDTIIKINSKHE